MSKKPSKPSRREFIRVSAVTGIASTGIASLAQPSSAVAQAPATSPQNALPKIEPIRMYEGTAAGAVVEQLRTAGVKTIFHTNTSGFSPLWDAIYSAGDVQIIMVTHEGQGVATAAGYAMASQNLGFFVGSGVGIGNAMSNIYCAWKDRVPLLATFSHGDLEAQGKDGAESWDGNLKPTETFTNWTGSFLTNSMTDVLRRAINFAYGPPSGPVTLDWGNARQAEKVKLPIFNIDLKKARASFRAKPDEIQKAAQWLAEAQNPLFLVGPDVTHEGVTEEFRALAEKLAVPVAVLGWPNELYANFPTDHPLFLGEYSPVNRFPKNVDLFMNFGEKFAERAPQGAASVHITHDPGQLERVFPVDLPIASDLRSAIRDLSDALDSMLTKDRINKIRAARMEAVATFTSKLKESHQMALKGRFDATPLSWERVGYELEQALDKDAVIVPEVGTQSQKLLSQLKFGNGNKLRIGRTTGSALGWGVAAALGVNLALPERQVVSIQGDGGFLFGQTENLWSISRYEAPMLIVVMNNHVYNDSRVRNMMDGGTLFQAGKDLTGHLGNPYVDFTKIAEAYSLKGEKVRTPGELAPALQRSIRSMRDGKAVVLDIEIAPDGQPLSENTWYQRHSVSEIRKRRRG
jgi:thiamine pyrophosphate-dependent acetolactate synthase large subunit-like protein